MNIYGLVIQGPISDSRYDAWANVLEIFVNYHHLFNQVVLSTWRGQESSLGNIPRGMDLVTSEDPFSESRPWPDNRNRQWVSSLAGIHQLRNEITHVLKVRTDQLFDIKEFLEEFEENCNAYPDYLESKREGFLHSFALVRGASYSICDFAMVGPKNAMRDFYSVQVEYSNILLTKSIDIPESDSVRKYLHDLLPRLFPGLAPVATMPRLDATPVAKHGRGSGVDPSLLVLWEFSLRQIFSVSSRSLMLGLRWRGSMVSKDYVDENFVFRDEWIKMRQNLAIQSLVNHRPWERLDVSSKFLTGRQRAALGKRGILTKILIAIQAGHIRHANGSIFWGTKR